MCKKYDDTPIWLLFCSSVLFVATAFVFLAVTRCCEGLIGRHFEIILTFVGIIGTFVVVTNFHQVENVKRDFKEAVEENNQKYRQFVEKYQPMLEVMRSSDEYRLATDMVSKKGSRMSKCFIYYRCECTPQTPLAYRMESVYIKDMCYDDKGLCIKFVDENEKEYSFPGNVILIKEEKSFDSKGIRLDNPMLQSFIRSMLYPVEIGEQ